MQPRRLPHGIIGGEHDRSHRGVHQHLPGCRYVRMGHVRPGHIEHGEPGVRLPAGPGRDLRRVPTAFASPTCLDTVCMLITVEPGLTVHVPNAFSPDGDGINDGFLPVVLGVDPEVYRFDVFDRWANRSSPVNALGGLGRNVRRRCGDACRRVRVEARAARRHDHRSRMERVGHVTLVR